MFRRGCRRRPAPAWSRHTARSTCESYSPGRCSPPCRPRRTNRSLCSGPRRTPSASGVWWDRIPWALLRKRGLFGPPLLTRVRRKRMRRQEPGRPAFAADRVEISSVSWDLVRLVGRVAFRAALAGVVVMRIDLVKPGWPRRAGFVTTHALAESHLGKLDLWIFDVRAGRPVAVLAGEALVLSRGNLFDMVCMAVVARAAPGPIGLPCSNFAQGVAAIMAILAEGRRNQQRAGREEQRDNDNGGQGQPGQLRRHAKEGFHSVALSR